ncbi:MAG: hypothetical protein ABL973_16880 [Micropepsaceae bacterium]
MWRLTLVPSLLLSLLVSPSSAQDQNWMADARTGCRLWNIDHDLTSVQWSGPCANSLAHGYGISRWYANGVLDETNEGDYRFGKRNGRVTIRWADGKTFEGMWQNDLPNGAGTMRTREGEIFSGNWTNGCFQQGDRRYAVGATLKECGFE